MVCCADNQKNSPVTSAILQKMKKDGEKITMLTAYDYLTAELIDEAGVDIVLVGDSLAMVMLGYETTLPVTMEEMLHHTKAVVTGAKRAMVVGDMPFMSYHANEEQALINAGRFLKEAGAHAVKIEGGSEMVPVINKINAAGIPIMGHLGLTPQSIHQFGGYDVRAQEKKEAEKLLKDAVAIEAAGVFSIVLEKIPARLAKEVTKNANVPTIGIGAGQDCDGQVLVTHDMLGMFTKFVPKFVKQYANLAGDIKGAVENYNKDVKEGKFPEKKHSY